MLCEAFHRYLKHVLLQSKVNRRTDKLLDILFECAMTYEANYARETIKPAMHGNTQAQITSARHRNSQELKDKVEKGERSLVAISESKWEVESENESGKKYEIQLNFHVVCPCQIKCRYCYVCRCKYSCSCFDYQFKHICCKHIHVVGAIYPDTQENDVPSSPVPVPPSYPVRTLVRLQQKPDLPKMNLEFQMKFSEIEAQFGRQNNPLVKAHAMKMLNNIGTFLLTNETQQSIPKFSVEDDRRNSTSRHNAPKQQRFVYRKDQSRRNTYAVNVAAVKEDASKRLADIVHDDVNMMYCKVCLNSCVTGENGVRFCPICQNNMSSNTNQKRKASRNSAEPVIKEPKDSIL